ncbi:hypothetical protein HDU79_000422, partial [Rhizoclosmatium sp. JEL0117]
IQKETLQAAYFDVLDLCGSLDVLVEMEEESMRRLFIDGPRKAFGCYWLFIATALYREVLVAPYVSTVWSLTAPAAQVCLPTVFVVVASDAAWLWPSLAPIKVATASAVTPVSAGLEILFAGIESPVKVAPSSPWMSGIQNTFELVRLLDSQGTMETCPWIHTLLPTCGLIAPAITTGFVGFEPSLYVSMSVVLGVFNLFVIAIASKLLRDAHAESQRVQTESEDFYLGVLNALRVSHQVSLNLMEAHYRATIDDLQRSHACHLSNALASYVSQANSGSATPYLASANVEELSPVQLVDLSPEFAAPELPQVVPAEESDEVRADLEAKKEKAVLRSFYAYLRARDGLEANTRVLRDALWDVKVAAMNNGWAHSWWAVEKRCSQY